MPPESQKLWSSVGSAGVVNLPDVGKIVFNKSIAQLGPGGAIVVKPNARSEATPPGTQTVSAIIRYGVVPVGGVYADTASDPSLGIALKLRYRDGSGHVLAKFIEVNIQSGAENTLLTFDSGQPGASSSNAFQVLTSPVRQPTLDFVANAYYVELTLTVTEGLRPPPYPPAVEVVQIALADPPIQ